MQCPFAPRWLDSHSGICRAVQGCGAANSLPTGLQRRRSRVELRNGTGSGFEDFIEALLAANSNSMKQGKLLKLRFESFILRQMPRDLSEAALHASSGETALCRSCSVMRSCAAQLAEDSSKECAFGNLQTSTRTSSVSLEAVSCPTAGLRAGASRCSSVDMQI